MALPSAASTSSAKASALRLSAMSVSTYQGWRSANGDLRLAEKRSTIDSAKSDSNSNAVMRSPKASFMWLRSANACRGDASAIVLFDGRVLVTGGTGIDGQRLATIEVYHPGS